MRAYSLLNCIDAHNLQKNDADREIGLNSANFADNYDLASIGVVTAESEILYLLKA
jgi:hypothetical protein